MITFLTPDNSKYWPISEGGLSANATVKSAFCVVNKGQKTEFKILKSLRDWRPGEGRFTDIARCKTPKGIEEIIFKSHIQTVLDAFDVSGYIPYRKSTLQKKSGDLEGAKQRAPLARRISN